MNADRKSTSIHLIVIILSTLNAHRYGKMEVIYRKKARNYKCYKWHNDMT